MGDRVDSVEDHRAVLVDCDNVSPDMGRGELLFNSQQPGQPWDGSYGGSLVQDGVYVWKLTWRDPYTTNEIEAMGHVTVMR